MKSFIYTAALALAMGSAHTALAAEAPAQSEAKSSIAMKAQDFGKDLDTASQRHFTMIYSNYNIVKVVESVHEDIENAIDVCGEENPDMKEMLDARLEVWEAAVLPIIEEAEEHVENMIKAQDYSEPKKIEAFLDDIDEDREERANEIDKKPVTTPTACQHLHDTMDETQAQLTRLLQATLVSLPQDVQQELDENIRQRKEQAEADEAAEAAKAEQEAEAEAAIESETADEPEDEAGDESGQE